MSQYSLVDGTVPHASAALVLLSNLLDKIEEHAAATSTSTEDYVSSRLAPDMLPFAFQIHSACDSAAKLVAVCQGLESPAWESYETLKTVSGLRQRIKTAQEFVQAADAAKFLAADEPVKFNIGPQREFTTKVSEYAAGFAIPNMYFHVVTAYNILRNGGIKIGKQDFLTPFIGRYLS